MGAFAYDLSKLIVTNLFRPFLRIEVGGREHTHIDGPCILAANHLSHFDPPLFTSIHPRRIDWMAMTELFQAPWMARYFHAVDCIEVDRFGTDTHAIREAIQRLRQGRLLGLFPEGGIRAGTTSVLQGAPFKGGVGMLAQMTGATVLPAVILGSDRCYAPATWRSWRKTRICILYGPPLTIDPHLPKKTSRNAIDQTLSQTFQSLYHQAIAQFQLQPDDLPQTPQARKGREP